MSFSCVDLDSTLHQNSDGLLDINFPVDSGFEIDSGFGGGFSLIDSERAPIWKSFTPEWVGIGLNGGRQTARYMKVNKLIFFSVSIYLSSSTTMSSYPYFVPPVPYAASFTGLGSSGYYSTVGQCWIEDAGVRNYDGVVYEYNGNFYPGALNSTPTYWPYVAGFTGASVPFAWASGDMFSLQGWYKSE